MSGRKERKQKIEDKGWRMDSKETKSYTEAE